MAPEDDPEAYLVTFERVAAVAGWAPDQWATLLAPYLTGPAQKAYRGLPDDEARVYARVKAAILDAFDITPETFRRRFRGKRYLPGARPRAITQELKDAASRWLQPERRTAADVTEQIVLEQFIHILPTPRRAWVLRHRPQTLPVAITLTEDFLEAEAPLGPAARSPQAGPGTQRLERGPSSKPGTLPRVRRPEGGGTSFPQHPETPPCTGSGRWVRPPGPGQPCGPSGVPTRSGRPELGPCVRCGENGHLQRDCTAMECDFGRVYAGERRARPPSAAKVTAPMEVAGTHVVGLIDSGCGQTLVRQALLPDGQRSTGEVRIQCIHGDVRPYPTVQVPLTLNGATQLLSVAVAPSLAYLVILGRDWPGFVEVLRSLSPAEAFEGASSDTDIGPSTPADPDAAPFLIPGPDRPGTGGPSDDTVDFSRDQREDPTLRFAYEQLARVEGDVVDAHRTTQWPRFELSRDRLYRVERDPRTEEVRTQLVVPRIHRRAVLKLAHDIPAAGHLGSEKTAARVLAKFFWPGIHREVKDYCTSCPDCQHAASAGVRKAPLVPLPVVGVPFERVAMDLVGPFPKSQVGYQYILVVMDYATRFPEAVPLRSITARTIAAELLKIFARVGLPREVLTDQGTNFTSKLFRQVCALLGIKKLQTSVYHPQMDGLVERFNRTLKGMLRRFPTQDLRRWDQLLPPLLLAIREVPQASTKFSPFELLYGQRPHGVLDLLRETWEHTPSATQGLLQYVLQLQGRLARVGELAWENLNTAQRTQEAHYNRGAQARTFVPGDRVLLLLPSEESKLFARWQGPYEVLRRLGPVTYEIRQPGRRKQKQIYHINLLKPWREREGLLIAPYPPEPDLGPGLPEVSETGGPQLAETLTPEQQVQATCLVNAFPKTFTTKPGRTTLAHHVIQTDPGVVVRGTTRPLPRRMREAVEEEVQAMLELGVIERSQSEWRSPVVLVPKPDGSRRFCIDFRRVNALSKFDAYPMPRVDELLDRLGEAHYITTLDLTKGYWQIPLEPRSKEKTAFATLSGLYHFTRMPFGLHGAPAIFQRLMDRVLQPHITYAAAYLDDVVIYGSNWEDHLNQVAAVLRDLRAAGLTANPKKCQIGREETTYLGYTLGRGLVRPLVGKVQALQECQPPTTKRQVRQFLGLAGYYRRFVPHFATLTAPLTDLLTKNSPRQVCWLADCEKAFQAVKPGCVASRYFSARTFIATLSCRPMPPTWGLGRSSRRRWTGRSIRWFTLAGSCSPESETTPSWRKRPWRLSGQWTPSAITSLELPLRLLRITPP
ncbi:uncharacterized protein LOC123363556 [Mauremys mutica]|uniref:uncharacterized protein LOC123363556 n=1 Tax=Mauremys mutica TaxID=74926 RepID=UPI001D16C724|nr:uncharacterized protein LOC123363556 [Mauremys mutica]